MKPSKSKPPTEAELVILQILWRLGSATVKEVQEAMAPGTGYTTALKFLQLMTEKGLVKRNETQRAHVYRAAEPRENTQQHLMANLVEKAFGGSISQLVLQALSSKTATAEERREIRRLLEKIIPPR